MGFFDTLFGRGSNKASKEASAEEERRKKEIADSQRRVEGIFGSPERNQQIEDFVSAQRGLLMSDLGREKGKNDRELKFSLARSGLSGGSTDIDQNRNLSELYLRGVAEAERRAQTSGSELRSNDQQSKQQLFSQILGGADATTSANNAAQMMRVNTSLAGQNGSFGAFDSLFGDFSGIYKNSKEAAGERRANRDLSFGTLFSPTQQSQVNVAGAV